MSKLDLIDLPRSYNKNNNQQQNSTTLRKFPFRSQSLRFHKKSNKSQQQLQQPNHQLIRQQTVPASSTTCLSLSILILKDRDLIISSSSYENTSYPITPTGHQQLTRHQSIKSFHQNSHSPSLNNCVSNFFIGNSPAITAQQSPLRVLDDNIFEDSVVTQEESEEDEDYCTEDDEPHYEKFNVFCRRPRTVILNRDPHVGIGILIIGGCDVGIPVTIVGLKPHSPAQFTSNIFIGDQILSVNGVPLNENTTHQDALRLLAECGHKVSLSLKHTKSVMNFCKKWEHRKVSILNYIFNNNTNSNNIQNENENLIQNQNIRRLHGRQMSLFYSTKDFNRTIPIDEDDTTTTNCLRINLFLSGISQYVSYSDKLRDSGFEIQANNERSIVIQCLSKEICSKWFTVIKSTIENLTNSFMQNFNKHFPRSKHFFFMGLVSELVTLESFSFLSSIFSSSKSLPSSNFHHHHNRWLSRFLIVKGGKIYLFKKAPTATLLNYKRKIGNILSLRKHRTNSNGSSLGSVGSGSTSASEASNSSSTNSTTHLNGLVKMDASAFSSCLKVVSKPDRLNRINKCLENELDLLALEYWHCYQSDFRCLKPAEQLDDKNDCFMICSGNSQQRYFSTECRVQLQLLNDAWNIANYNSVIKNDNKIYTVVLERDNIIGSLKIDWKYGFSFYDPKRNNFLWSYRFHQLKDSSDNGKDILSLTFMLDPSDSRIVETHILRCSCLQPIIYSIHAFLRAKVFSLYL